jgi:hypothetical protein
MALNNMLADFPLAKKGIKAFPSGFVLEFPRLMIGIDVSRIFVNGLVDCRTKPWLEGLLWV